MQALQFCIFGRSVGQITSFTNGFPWTLANDPEQLRGDDAHYNLMFDAYDDANATWRYLDLTAHVEYLYAIIDLTIQNEMRQEASYLCSLRQARTAVKELLDGPDMDIDRIICLIRDNNGAISNKLKEEFSQLTDIKLSDDIVLA